MNTFPLFHKLDNQPIIIIGGGEVALRKADLLQRSGANLTIIAPQISPELKSLLTQNSKHQLIEQNYDKSYLANKRLAIVATDNHELNLAIHADCKAINLPVNVVDTPELCDFIFPAIVDRNPITIGISSNGKAPVLARLLRAKIETSIPQHYGKLAKMAGDFRDEVKEKLPTINARRKFWEHAFTGSVAELVFAGNHDTAQTQLETDLHTLSQLYQTNSQNKNDLDNDHDSAPNINSNINNNDGEVYIVGAGAGDPELLTFKALRLMQQADIVFYDALVSDEILDLCRRDSDKVFVGKKRCNHAVAQENINELLVKHAKQGKRVVRLKGGDPFVFGRGGEEAEELIKHGVAYQIVPGVTAATAAASYAGIPLTHRDYARSVRFVTGCLKKGTPNEQFSTMLEPNETIVFYMGLHALERLTTGLIDAGKPSDTPIAIVANASRPNQQVLTGTLANIVSKQAKAQLPTPALLIMGDVVNLHDKLKWYAGHENVGKLTV